ncbi:MAG: hypothetical protein HWN80_12175 [Candidatus Lokiarchaeota archaeon]|nr:hypothetical protein [Candidatus Lokiarchaeota archaeon]
MSSPADSFFNIFFTLTFTVVFIGTLVLTVVAPTNIWPGSLLYPKYKVVCVLACELVEIPINGIWGGLINGVTYGVLATAGLTAIRLIKRK